MQACEVNGLPRAVGKVAGVGGIGAQRSRGGLRPNGSERLSAILAVSARTKAKAEHQQPCGRPIGTTRGWLHINLHFVAAYWAGYASTTLRHR